MFQGILQIIIDTIAALFGGIMLLRFWLYAVRVRPPNQLGNFIYTMTNWFCSPLQKMVPNTRYDLASFIGAVLFAFICAIAKTMLIIPVFMVKIILILTVLNLINWIIYGIMGLLILEVIFSWVNPNSYLAPLVSALNRPFLNPIRKLIPPIAGIDLSVLIAFVILHIASRFLPELVLRFGS